MAQTEKDKLVDQLFEKLKVKQEEIAKVERPDWKTNCSFSYNRNGNDRVNIQTVSDSEVLVDALAALIERAKAHTEASKILNSTAPFKWLGFTLEEWQSDFQTRVNKINIAAKKKELTELETALNKLVSPDKREAMELERITKMLS